MTLRSLIIILLYIGQSHALFAFGSDHSSLKPQITSSANTIEAVFVITANPGLELTFEAPWALEVSNVENLDIANEKALVVKEFDTSISGMRFKANVSPKAKSVSFDYKMKAFVCTTDKKRCYPQTHKGSINYDINKPKPAPLNP